MTNYKRNHMICWKSIFQSLLIVSVLHFSSMAQPNKDLLAFGVTGSIEKTPVNKNPLNLLNNKSVQHFLLSISNAPMPAKYPLQKARQEGISIESLVDAGIIVFRNDSCFLNFTLLNEQDLVLIHKVSSAKAKSLAQLILNDSTFYKVLLQNADYPLHLQKEALFVLIGCFSLDWDGLTLTEKIGMRTSASLNQYGDKYRLWGKQNVANLPTKYLYWGSHNDYLNDIVYTSFGEHDSASRYALPDMKWKYRIAFGKNYYPKELVSEYQSISDMFFDTVFYNAGKLLLSLFNKPLTLQQMKTQSTFTGLSETINFLTSLKYIKLDSVSNKYYLNIPVFTKNHLQMTQTVRKHTAKILENWLNENYALIKDQLSGLSSKRHGLDYDIVFTEVYHFLFGYVNKILSESGFFVNPALPDRFHKGYVPVVWDSGLINDEY